MNLPQPTAPSRLVRVLGIRGVPAAHGGFETFTETLAPALVERGWRVVVYCQAQGHGPWVYDQWRGVERVHVPVTDSGALGTVVFDWRCITHVLAQARYGESGVCLTLGYNTAVFTARLRWAGVPNVLNMDGIEWKRDKWSAVARTWFRLNEWAGCRMADHLVADHPAIAEHLAPHGVRARTTVIPYGADGVSPSELPDVHDALARLGLTSGRYATVIARAEPENSILEIVRGWSARPRGRLLAVLGRYDEREPYHRAVRAAAGPEVRFLGPIFERPLVQQLRAHAWLYLHGHRVGGTNPSLVEALAAGNAVVAHDNAFNRWVAGEGARHFTDEQSLDAVLSQLQGSPDDVAQMATMSRQRHAAAFTQSSVIASYADLLATRVSHARVAASG